MVSAPGFSYPVDFYASYGLPYGYPATAQWPGQGYYDPYATYPQPFSQPALAAAPVASAPISPLLASPAAATLDISTQPIVFPLPSLSLGGKALFTLKHPILAATFWKNNPKAKINGETANQRWGMFAGVVSQLNAKNQRNLLGQMTSGRLFSTDAEDGRSTLSHMYQVIATPRAEGMNPQDIINDVARLLAQPESITQRFAPLKPNYIRALMNFLNAGRGPKLAQPVTPESFSDHSATCVSSSVMYTLFAKQPSEVVRHIAELTSPRQYFTERATAYQISPENPALAAQKLEQYKVPAKQLDANNFMIKVELPYTGLVRALNQQNNPEPETQSVVESAYQSAVTKLAAFNYEPGLGTLVLPDGKLDKDPGIVADQKTLMESIMKDTGPVMQVDYQVTAADRNNEPFLMGYLRPFEKTYNDLVSALKAGHNVIIGIVDTDKTGNTKGRLNLKHEVTLVGHKDGMFQIADSDDEIPRLIHKPASELIPQIHHAGLPETIGRAVQKDISQLSGRYMTPDAGDAKNFKLIDIVPPQIQPQFLADFQQRQAQEMQRAVAVPNYSVSA